MTRFFDIGKKVLYFMYIALITLLFFAPTVPALPDRKPLIAVFCQSLGDMPSHFSEILSDTSLSTDAQARTLVRDVFVAIFFFFFFFSLIFSLVTFFRKKRCRLFIFLLCASLFVVCYGTIYANLPDNNGIPRLAYHYVSYPNATAVFALFALYVLYLLLRRFYAPAKARVVASVERRKASRKPTKDERIAELEKRVAELESKDEHQKSTPS